MAAHRFNDLEGLRIAVEIERKGQQFYRSVLALVSNAEAAAVIRQLADEENDHMKRFNKLYEEALQIYDEEEIAPFEEETNAYLSAIAAEVVFPGGAMRHALSGKTQGMDEILNASMDAEKDSILFYIELLAQTKNPQAREAFGQIIIDEKAHLIKLQQMMVAMRDIPLKK